MGTVKEQECKFCEGYCDVKERVFLNGTLHLEAICRRCERHNGFVARPIPPDQYQMPYGPHAGHSILWIVENHRSYADWLVRQPSTGKSIRAQFEAAFEVSAALDRAEEKMALNG